MYLSPLRSLGTSPGKPHRPTLCLARPSPDTLALAQGPGASGGEPGVRAGARIWRTVAERHVVLLLWVEIRFHHLTLTRRASEQGAGRWCQPGPASQLLPFLWSGAGSFMDLPMSDASHWLDEQDGQAYPCRKRRGSKSSQESLQLRCDPAHPYQSAPLEGSR